jgi:hypothetical protein
VPVGSGFAGGGLDGTGEQPSGDGLADCFEFAAHSHPFSDHIMRA